MSEPEDGPAAVLWRSSTAQAVPVSVMVASPGALLIAPTLGESGRAAVAVGFVLAEAIALYVGYGALTRVVNSAVHEILVSE